jgi:diaminopropionate ammonia-lyase
MTGLACGTPSTLAWPIIQDMATGFFVISDDDARWGLSELRRNHLTGGPCSGAALGALRVLADYLDLTGKSVLTFGTEAATQG